MRAQPAFILSPLRNAVRMLIFSFIKKTERKIASLQEDFEEAEKLAQAAMEEKGQVSGQAAKLEQRLKDLETEF